MATADFTIHNGDLLRLVLILPKPILLTSVAPKGTPPAGLVNKLAFGIHLTPIWSPDVDGDDDDVRPGPQRKNLEKGSPRALRFGSQNGPQNRSKTNPILDPFLDTFWTQFWIAFGGLLGAIWAPRLARERSGGAYLNGPVRL